MEKFLFFILSVVILTTSEASAQCNAENLSDDCIPKLASGFNFLKSYKVDGVGGSKDKVEYSYVFTKGTQYMINICTPTQATTDGVIVTLFDSQRNKVASSKVNGQFISAMAFPCNATGIYYIQYTFDESDSYCAGSAMGFKR